MRTLARHLVLALALAAILPLAACGTDVPGCARISAFSANPTPADAGAERWAAVDVSECGALTAARLVRFEPVGEAPIALTLSEDPELACLVGEAPGALIFDVAWRLVLYRDGVVEDAVTSVDVGAEPDNGLAWYLEEGSWAPHLPTRPACELVDP